MPLKLLISCPHYIFPYSLFSGCILISLTYFILTVPLRNCSGLHSCMSFIFSSATLNENLSYSRGKIVQAQVAASSIKTQKNNNNINNNNNNNNNKKYLFISGSRRLWRQPWKRARTALVPQPRQPPSRCPPLPPVQVKTPPHPPLQVKTPSHPPLQVKIPSHLPLQLVENPIPLHPTHQ